MPSNPKRKGVSTRASTKRRRGPANPPITPQTASNSVGQSPLTNQPSLVSQPSLSNQPSLVSQPLLTNQPSSISQPSLTNQPSLASQTSLTNQPAIFSQPSLTNQPSVVSQPSFPQPVYVNPPQAPLGFANQPWLPQTVSQPVHTVVCVPQPLPNQAQALASGTLPVLPQSASYQSDMTSVETAPLPSQPSGIKDPTVSITEIVSDPSPVQGSDGRLAGDDVNRIPEVPKPLQETNVNADYTKDQSNDMDTDTTKTEDKSKVTEHRILEPEKEMKIDETSEHVIDIVKQSKLQGTTKSTSDLGELPEFPPSRPLTETTARDGTKVSIDIENEKRASNTNLRASNTNLDKETKTPFSVRVERKPLHTAQTRSHSDYFSKTPSTSRYTYIAASLSQYTEFEPDLKGKENFFRQAPPQQMRARRPPKLVRLATVTMSPKTKPAPRGPSLYYEEPKKPSKVITWDEATEARPPLRIDMEGPGPTNYSPRIKPLMETNSPAWTFGGKCQPEKAGGSRTSWEKTWFASPSVWTNKVDFYNDSAWPSPTHYKSKPVLGPRQRTMTEFPSFTIGTRNEMTMSKSGSDKEPSPVDYDKDIADKLVHRRGPSFSHQFRREGTIMWGSQDKTPGPGAYTPNYSYNKPHCPSFSIRSLRREKSHVLGPFSTF